MRRSLFLILATIAVAQDRTGLKPRADLADYPAHAERDGVAVGAALLPPEQVRNTFATDLNRGYLVVEVALYPQKDRALDVEAAGFTLRIPGTQTLVRPASPRAIAAILQKPSSSPNDVTIYPQVGIGYESGGPSYDPVYGTRRGRGVYMSAGVGVGVGGSRRPASTDRDRRTMEMELSEKSLSEGIASKPVAGYLYFPVGTRKKGVTYQLEYGAPGGRIALPLPSK